MAQSAEWALSAGVPRRSDSLMGMDWIHAMQDDVNGTKPSLHAVPWITLGSVALARDCSAQPIRGLKV